MQNSIWKLAALAGVVALGFFAVLQTQRGLQTGTGPAVGDAPEATAKSNAGQESSRDAAQPNPALLVESQTEPSVNRNDAIGDEAGNTSGSADRNFVPESPVRDAGVPSFGVLDGPGKTPAGNAAKDAGAASSGAGSSFGAAGPSGDSSKTTDANPNQGSGLPSFGTLDLSDEASAPRSRSQEKVPPGSSDDKRVRPLFGAPDPKSASAGKTGHADGSQPDTGPQFSGPDGDAGGAQSAPGFPGAQPRSSKAESSTPAGDSASGPDGPDNPFAHPPAGQQQPKQDGEEVRGLKILPRNDTKTAKDDGKPDVESLFGGDATKQLGSKGPSAKTSTSPGKPSSQPSAKQSGDKPQPLFPGEPFPAEGSAPSAKDGRAGKKEQAPEPLFGPSFGGEKKQAAQKSPATESSSSPPTFPNEGSARPEAHPSKTEEGPGQAKGSSPAPRLMPDSRATQLLPGSPTGDETPAKAAAVRTPFPGPESPSKKTGSGKPGSPPASKESTAPKKEAASNRHAPPMDDSGRAADAETTERQSSQLTIEKSAPKSAVLGQPFVYDIIIKNRSANTAHQVTVEDPIPSGVRLEGSDPQAVLSSGKLIWKLGKLRAGETRKISVKVTPVRAGQIGSVATVNFVSEVAARTTITAPRLSLKFTGPQSAKIGDKVTFKFVVTNSGNAAAADVWIRDLIPDGLTHPAGNDLEYKVGKLAPGKSQSITLTMSVAKSGRLTNRAIVTAAGGVRIESRAVVAVKAPELVVVRSGPKQRLLGSRAVFQNMLKNASQQTVRGTTLREVVPAGMEFVEASDGGTFDAATRTVSWNVGTLAPQQSKTVRLTLLPKQAGRQQSLVKAVSADGTVVQTSSVTKVAGYAALGVEVPAVDKPVAVGKQVALRIVARNRGTAASSNVRLQMTLPAQLEIAAVRGPGKYASKDGTLTFDSVDSIAPGGQVVYDVTLKAVARGDSRVKIQIQSDEMSQPLAREEAVLVLPNP